MFCSRAQYVWFGRGGWEEVGNGLGSIGVTKCSIWQCCVGIVCLLYSPLFCTSVLTHISSLPCHLPNHYCLLFALLIPRFSDYVVWEPDVQSWESMQDLNLLLWLFILPTTTAVTVHVQHYEGLYEILFESVCLLSAGCWPCFRAWPFGAATCINTLAFRHGQLHLKNLIQGCLSAIPLLFSFYNLTL